jgi:hypothetical protein
LLKFKKKAFFLMFVSFSSLHISDCLHLQLYRDSKEWYKNGPTKASLSLQHFLGIETGFTLDKESNTIAILCQDVIVVLAFDTREKLIQWQVSARHKSKNIEENGSKRKTFFITSNNASAEIMHFYMITF